MTNPVHLVINGRSVRAESDWSVLETARHNGIKIHDAAVLKNDARKGGLHFQDHGNPVRYRDIWIVPVEKNKSMPKLMRPYVDIYLVYAKSAVSVKASRRK